MQLSTNSGLHSAREGKERYSLAETVEFCADAGFTVLDVNFSASIYDDPFRIDRTITESDWRQRIHLLKQDLDRRNVHARYSHLPFYRYDLPNTENAELKREVTFRAIEASGILGVEWAVVHPSRLEDRDQARRETQRYLESLLESAERYGVGIAVENMSQPGSYCVDHEDLCSLVDGFGGKIGICWDTGHANLARIDQEFSIRKIGNRLKVLHIHDNSGYSDEHRPPFLGTVKWQEIMCALKSIQFAGDLNFEVSATHIPEALRRVHAEYLVECGKHLLTMYQDA